MEDFLLVTTVVATVLWYGILLRKGVTVKDTLRKAFSHPYGYWSLVIIIGCAGWLSWAGINRTTAPFYLFIASHVLFYCSLVFRFRKRVVVWMAGISIMCMVGLSLLNIHWLSVAVTGCYGIVVSVLYFKHLLHSDSLCPSNLLWTNSGILFFTISQLLIYLFNLRETSLPEEAIEWKLLSILSNWILLWFVLADIVSMRHPVIGIRNRFMRFPDSKTYNQSY
jgi:hypothetical protein